MPFTPAHPAAAVPLRRLLGRYGVLSALVIGSMTPDLAYLAPFYWLQINSHSIPGLFTFCLPFGVLGYLVFHLLLKRPFLSILSRFVAERVSGLESARRSFPRASVSAVLVSLLAGAATHIAWDSFTHEKGAVVLVVPALQIPLFTVGGYTIHVFKLLQYLSTMVGVALLAAWSWSWLRSVPPAPRVVPALSGRSRVAVVAMTLVIVSGVGLWRLGTPERWLDLRGFRHYAYHAGIASLSVMVLAVLVFSFVWHVTLGWRAQREPAAPR